MQRAVRVRSGFQLLGSDTLLAIAPPETQRRERPWTLRAKVRYNDTTFDLGVAPDDVFAIQYPDGRFRAYLVEVDRGTMPVDRSNLHQNRVDCDRRSLGRKSAVVSLSKPIGL